MSNQQAKQSWRHQFRTPKKIRKQKLLQQHALKKNGRKLETTVRKPFLVKSTVENNNQQNDIHAVGINSPTPKLPQPHPIQTSKADTAVKPNDKIISTTETNSKLSNNSPEGYVAMTYGIMRSIVAATAYIEQNGGFELKDLYIMSTTRNINKMKVNNSIFHCLQPAVNKCIDLMLKGEMEQIEHFESVFSSFSSRFDFDTDNHKPNIVAMALKGVLHHCEPLIPTCKYQQMMNIHDGYEAEKLLSSPNWPNLTSMTFILVLNHLAKLCNSRRVASGHQNQSIDENRDLVYMKALAKEFGTVLLQRVEVQIDVVFSSISDKSPRTFFSKKKISSLIRKKGTKKTSRVCSNREKKDVMMLIISHMSKDQSIRNDDKESPSPAYPMREVTIVDEYKDSSDLSENRINYQEDDFLSVEYKVHLLQNDDIEDKTTIGEAKNVNVTTSKLDRAYTAEVPQDEAKVEGMDIILNEDLIMKARRRLESAELTLKRMESCCLSFL